MLIGMESLAPGNEWSLGAGTGLELELERVRAGAGAGAESIKQRYLVCFSSQIGGGTSSLYISSGQPWQSIV